MQRQEWMMTFTRRTLLSGGAGGLLAAASLKAPPVLAMSSRAALSKSNRRLRILILGGTKFLGPEVVRLALRRGHEVTLFNRGKTQPWLFPAVPRLVGDRFPERGSGLKALEQGTWDACIDLPAYYPRLVAASADLLAQRVKRYVMMSSISVYADFKTVGLTEASAVRKLSKAIVEEPDLEENGWDTYGARKALCEQAVTDRFGKQATIVRASTIIGGETSDPTGFYWPARLSGSERVLAPGTGEDLVQFVDVRDVATFIVDAVERDLGGTFNLASQPREHNLRSYLAAAQQVVGGSADIRWANRHEDEFSAFPLYTPMQRVPGFAQIRSDLARQLGWTTRPISETIRADWLAGIERFPPGFDFAKNGTGLSRDREAALLASVT